jgi:hypothetical protein
MYCLVILIFLLFSCAQEYSNTTDFTAVYNGKTLEITGYKGSSEDIVIPNEIDGITVTSIGNQTFLNKCKSVVIQNSIQTIKYKFSLVNIFRQGKLERITIGASVDIGSGMKTKGGLAGGSGRFVLLKRSYNNKAGTYTFKPNILTGGKWDIQ